MRDAEMKKAVLVVSFGTSHEDTRAKTIDAVTAEIAETLKGYDVRTAFTSSIIKKILERRGKSIDNVEQALTKLRDEGYEKVIIQPLHVICGEEFHNILKETAAFKNDFASLKIGNPLLTHIDDYRMVVKAFDAEIKATNNETAIVFMGHGTHHPANSAYACLQSIFNDEGYNNVLIGTVEGHPEFDDVLTTLKKDGYKQVKLLPLMLVAGDHAKNDMAGEEEDSWKSILEAEGFEIEIVLKGMGENEAIRNLYVEHVKTVIK